MTDVTTLGRRWSKPCTTPDAFLHHLIATGVRGSIPGEGQARVQRRVRQGLRVVPKVRRAECGHDFQGDSKESKVLLHGSATSRAQLTSSCCVHPRNTCRGRNSSCRRSVRTRGSQTPDPMCAHRPRPVLPTPCHVRSAGRRRKELRPESTHVQLCGLLP